MTLERVKKHWTVVHYQLSRKHTAHSTSRRLSEVVFDLFISSDITVLIMNLELNLLWSQHMGNRDTYWISNKYNCKMQQFEIDLKIKNKKTKQQEEESRDETEKGQINQKKR